MGPRIFAPPRLSRQKRLNTRRSARKSLTPSVTNLPLDTTPLGSVRLMLKPIQRLNTLLIHMLPMPLLLHLLLPLFTLLQLLPTLLLTLSLPLSSTLAVKLPPSTVLTTQRSNLSPLRLS